MQWQIHRRRGPGAPPSKFSESVPEKMKYKEFSSQKKYHYIDTLGEKQHKNFIIFLQNSSKEYFRVILVGEREKSSKGKETKFQFF